jgi:hypothetical protein
VGLKLNGTHPLLVYVRDVSQLVDNINTIKKNTEGLNGVSKEVGLEVITGRLSILWCIHPLLGEASKQTTRKRLLLGSGPPTTMELLLVAVFSTGSAQRLCHSTGRVQFS